MKTPVSKTLPRKKVGAKEATRDFVLDGNPSEVTTAPFIVATYNGKTQADSGRVGKWLFFVPEKNIDDTWRNVKKAIEDGKLWKTAKASTAWGSKGSVYMVCVYTHDYEDEEDVMTIRDYLRTMGFRRPVVYKTDAQTRAGVYSDNTKGIAKYKA